METLAEDLATMVRTPLHDNHVELMRQIGTVRTFSVGEDLVKAGDPIDAFRAEHAGHRRGGLECVADVDVGAISTEDDELTGVHPDAGQPQRVRPGGVIGDGEPAERERRKDASGQESDRGRDRC